MQQVQAMLFLTVSEGVGISCRFVARPSLMGNDSGMINTRGSVAVLNTNSGICTLYP